eukprot:COSAG03_NODE_9041_length_750_cov_1.278034_1_plen_52_part_10
MHACGSASCPVNGLRITTLVQFDTCRNLRSDVPMAVLASPSAVWAHDSLANG